MFKHLFQQTDPVCCPSPSKQATSQLNLRSNFALIGGYTLGGQNPRGSQQWWLLLGVLYLKRKPEQLFWKQLFRIPASATIDTQHHLKYPATTFVQMT
jgi:hypothetical protein